MTDRVTTKRREGWRQVDRRGWGKEGHCLPIGLPTERGGGTGGRHRGMREKRENGGKKEKKIVYTVWVVGQREFHHFVMKGRSEKDSSLRKRF